MCTNKNFYFDMEHLFHLDLDVVFILKTTNISKYMVEPAVNVGRN